MTDKGLNLQDMFVHRNIQINMPIFFLKKKNRMSCSTVIQDRNTYPVKEFTLSVSLDLPKLSKF